MTGPPEEHIAEDRLEAFARGALSRAEGEQILAHVQRCARCRAALSAEISLAEGVRQSARDEFKRRLAARIAASRPAGVPWPRILGAAATILILAGIGIAYHWLSLPAELTDAPLLTQPAPVVESPQQSVEKRKVMPEESDALRERLTRREAEEAAPSPPVPEQPAEMTVAPQGVQTNEGGGVQPTAKGILRMKQPEAAYDVTLHQQPGVVVHQSVSIGDYATNLQTSARDRAVPARIVLQADTLVVTLFPDSLFNEADLRTAQSTFPRPDSLVLQIGAVRLGYRVPVTRR